VRWEYLLFRSMSAAALMANISDWNTGLFRVSSQSAEVCSVPEPISAGARSSRHEGTICVCIIVATEKNVNLFGGEGHNVSLV
jgi:hypothetical protein